MTKALKVAVIGLGKLGVRHATVYSKLTNVELFGVCDIHEEKAENTAIQLRTRAFSDHRELFGKVDAASIVVPSHAHHRISKEFLNHGIHLLIEKPITTHLRQADELLEIARKKKLTIQVGHIERFNSAIRAIKHVIKTPRFIQCHRFGPYDPRVADVGVTLDLMIHDIDIMLDLVRSPVKMIDSVGACVLSKTEDIANARVRFQNKCVCDLTASRITPDIVRKIRIFQEDAYISLDYVTQEAEIYAKENGHIHHQKIDITKSDSLKEELLDFVHCVRTGRKPLVSGKEGRDALELALKISKQIHRKK